MSEYHLEKVISGGQTGADIAGVKAAKAADITTGGTMPLGFKTLDGPRPEYAELYGMKEHSSPHYPGRTYQNVKDADGTVRFAVNFKTSGEECTLGAIKKYGKEKFDVSVLGTTTPEEMVDWMLQKNIRVLNVAGNSEQTAKGMEEFTVAFLSEVFKLLASLTPEPAL